MRQPTVTAPVIVPVPAVAVTLPPEHVPPTAPLPMTRPAGSVSVKLNDCVGLPAGCEIVSWNVVMGIGQIVTLRLPPRLLATVNVEIERSAWGVFETEFYPTYDFVPVRERIGREWRARTGRAEKK